MLLASRLAPYDMSAVSVAEITPLLPGSSRSSNGPPKPAGSRKLNLHYQCFRYRGAALLLVWNFTIPFVVILLETVMYNRVKDSVHSIVASTVLSRYNFLCFLLYPLAGLAADLACGRYTVIMLSVAINIGLLFIAVALEISEILIFPLTVQKGNNLIFALLALGILVLAVHSFFQANALQFGADHLHDASSEELRLFIHWFVWVQALAQFPIIIFENPYVTRLFTLHDQAITEYTTLIIACLVLLGGALLLVCHFTCLNMSAWFIHEPPSRNPYITVCQVLHFIKKHKVPVNRSSLTYWEEGLPQRMDLGKSKYGGPFSDEQVEDVKTLIGVSAILLSLGSSGYLQVPANPYPVLIEHVGASTGVKLISVLLASPTFLSVFVIPIHELLYRLCGRRPSMLGKLRLAMLMYVISVGINLLIDTVGHSMSNTTGQCMFIEDSTGSDISSTPSSFILLPALLSSLANVIINVTSMEFIIAQSPYSMRGMLIGLFFFSQGVFCITGSLCMLPFNLNLYVDPHLRLSCCSLYYIINFVVAFSILIVFWLITQKYQLRIRTEVINEYQIVEDHYSWRTGQIRSHDDSLQ